MTKPDSEKKVEKKLNEEIKKLGGMSIKLLSTHLTGLPDRLCLLPLGRVLFVELKTTGKKPRRIQNIVMQKIRKLGFRVETVDSLQGVNNLIESL